MEKSLLIYNPVAGDRSFSKKIDLIVDRLQNGGMYLTLLRINENNEFTEIINKENFDYIFVAGGDGTVNYAVNLIVNTDIKVPLGIFPVGTSNDFALSLGLNRHLDELCDRYVKRKNMLCDIGCVNGRYFINVAGAGLLADVPQKTDRSLINALGKLAYYVRGITELPKYRPFNAVVKEGGTNIVFNGEVILFLVMNSNTAGTFRKLAPTASVNDGFLDLLVFKNCSLQELVSLFVMALKGYHVKHDKVIYLKSSSIQISCSERIDTDVDGEKGPDFPLVFSVLQKRLKLLV